MEIFLIAIALSMDSAALSVANGAKCLNLSFAKAFKISFVYAFFQAIMPVFGFLLGISFVKFISEIDHFVAFGILAFLGVKMIKEALHYKGECSINLSTKELILGGLILIFLGFKILCEHLGIF